MLRLDDRAAIPRRAPGEVLIDVEAIGVNFIEIYQREGFYPLPRPSRSAPKAAGTVRAVGSGVTDLAVGDRVVSQRLKGAYAERAVVAGGARDAHPRGVSDEARGGRLASGTHRALSCRRRLYPLKPGDYALVHAAAGGVGLLLCQMAKKRGAFVIGTASTPEKRQLAHDAGADEVIDYTTVDFAAEARRITGGRGVDVVYDSVGKTTFDKSLDSIKRRGMLALFGQSSGPVPPIDPQILNQKGSLFMSRPTLNDYLATRAELVERGDRIARLGQERRAVGSHRG